MNYSLIEQRILEEARYLIDTKCTVRQAADALLTSKSTIHKDLTERLVSVNPALANEVRLVLDFNKSERHIRGGLATKRKFLQKNSFK